MVVKKVCARSSHEALRLVRQTLGSEALILSNRRTAAGVEILAVAESEITAITAAVAAHSAWQPSTTAASFQSSLARAAHTRHATPAIRLQPTTQTSAPAVHKSVPKAAMTPSAARGASTSVSATIAPPRLHEAGPELMREVKVLRSMVEGQLAAFAWNELSRRDSVKIELLRRLLAAGFSPSFARKQVDALPPGLDHPGALRVLKAGLQEALKLMPQDEEIVAQGGVFALVGPTGVGKTTTVAKLAAACALRHGASRLALVTTDTYRIGAVDQLRIYGKLLGVPVFAVRNDAELQMTLSDLRSRHMVLIDTVGMSQRDQRLADQLALLWGAGRRVKRVLLLAAVAQANVLEEIVQAYQGDGLAGCILTKVDESPTLGSALDVLMRNALPLHFVTNGQRVPEDLHRPNSLYLVERAFRAGDVMRARFASIDYPLMHALERPAAVAHL